MDEKQKAEMTEKAMNVAEEAAQKAKAAGLAAANKADEFYNKLPLDKINDKLGGKVNVKSKGFKIAAACVLVVILLLGIKLIFGGNSLESGLRDATNEAIKKDKNSAGAKCYKVTDINVIASEDGGKKKEGKAKAHIKSDSGESTVTIFFKVKGDTVDVTPAFGL